MNYRGTRGGAAGSHMQRSAGSYGQQHGGGHMQSAAGSHMQKNASSRAGRSYGYANKSEGNYNRQQGRRWSWLYPTSYYSAAPPPISSDWVSWAQSCLARVVGTWVPQNGIMGPETTRALQMFQSQQQLSVTGALDSNTVSALKAACSLPSGDPPPAPPPMAAAPGGPPGPEAPDEPDAGEMEELALAAELSAVSTEQELDLFLGSLLNDVAKSVSGFAHSAAGKAVGGILKSAAKQVLPFAGASLGGFLGGPFGAKIGGQLASGAGQVFGLELGETDHEFETNRRFVRFARHAAKRTAEAEPDMPPVERAKQSVVEAAQHYAPGLVEAAQSIFVGNESDQAHQHRSLAGKWVRHGKNIVIHGI